MISIPVIVITAPQTRVTLCPIRTYISLLQRSDSSHSIDMNPEGRKISPEPYTKHPLQDRWTLWYLQYERKKAWEDMQNKVYSFGTVEDFWCLYDHIKNASDLNDLNDYSVFKEHIRPMWEDPANRRGGRWILTSKYLRSDLDNLWMNTVSCSHLFENILVTKLHFHCYS